MAREIDLTLRVGVLTAGGLTRLEVLRYLEREGHQVDELDVRMALKRLRTIAGDWT